MSHAPNVRIFMSLAGAALLLAGCSSNAPAPERALEATEPARESIFGPGGLAWGPEADKARAEALAREGAGGVGVNAYLWRASLDTLSFLPITSADPFGGTVMTDWYSPPGTPDERFRVNAFVLDRQLRASGVRVALFRQVRDGSGNWADAPIDPAAQRQLEDAILTRARQLRVEQGPSS